MSDVTRLLERAHQGDRAAAEELLPLVYEELRTLAAQRMAQEAAGQTLQPTALVHEAWLKLVASYPDIRFTGEREFLALSGHLMRRVLTDHARSVNLLKRGGDLLRVTTRSGGLDARATEVDADELLALDLALTRLLEIDRRQVEGGELRYFAGFSIEETAELMELSPATVKREWAMARAWLRSALQEQA